MNDLVNRYASSEGSLIVVADERRFQPSGGLRPYTTSRSVDISDGTTAFMRHLSSITRAKAGDAASRHENLFVQDNANLYELVEGDPIETTSELFDELTEAPYLPLYKTFSNIFARRNELGVSPLESDDVIEAFGGWLRRRIEWDKSTASEIARSESVSLDLDGRNL